MVALSLIWRLKYWILGVVALLGAFLAGRHSVSPPVLLTTVTSGFSQTVDQIKAKVHQDKRVVTTTVTKKPSGEVTKKVVVEDTVTQTAKDESKNTDSQKTVETRATVADATPLRSNYSLGFTTELLPPSSTEPVWNGVRINGSIRLFGSPFSLQIENSLNRLNPSIGLRADF
jgi:hypothetical protein